MNARIVLSVALLSACAARDRGGLGTAEIGPAGGTITSDDSVLTIAFQPGALQSTETFTLRRSDEPPKIFGPAYRLRPTPPISIAITVTMRAPLPDDPQTAVIGRIDAAEFKAGTAAWAPVRRIGLDVTATKVTGLDDAVAVFYGLLEDPSLGGGGPGTDTGGDDGPDAGTSGDASTSGMPTSGVATDDDGPMEADDDATTAVTSDTGDAGTTGPTTGTDGGSTTSGATTDATTTGMGTTGATSDTTESGTSGGSSSTGT